MKKTLIIAALTLASPFIWAQTTTTTHKSTTTTTGDGSSTTTEKTTTTEGSGTITEYTPGKTIILKESEGPRTYRFGPHVVYETSGGKVIPEAEVHTRVRVGAPVHVRYMKEGDGYVVSRVIVGD